MERHGEIQGALDHLVEAARAHLEAVRAAQGVTDDEGVWQAYVALNNAAVAYDDLLHDVYGEVTPFDVEAITDDDQAPSTLVTLPPVVGGGDPHPRVVSVRQRRDYRVPSVAALLRVAELSRPAPMEGEDFEPVRTVGDAVLELLQSGDGSLGMLDLPELEPLDGVVVVAEVGQPLAADEAEDSDVPFRLDAGASVLGRLHEPLPPALDEA
jgi:hypothetical protein